MNNTQKVNPRESVLLMYSGGLDSTLLAAILVKKFQRVFLVTYDLPYTIGLSNVFKNIKKLKKINPDCHLTHHIIDLAGTRKLFFDDFYDDFFTYCKGGAPGIICFSCRMAMLMESVKFCLQNKIGNLAIGNTKVQANKAHSFPCNVKRFSDFMAKYNIIYTNDTYEIETREKEENLLKDYGIDVGKNIGLSSVTNQPRCALGVYSTLWLMGKPLCEKDMVQYFDDKLPLMEAYLSEFSHLKEGIRGNEKYKTEVDGALSGSWLYEFGPRVDRTLSAILTPFWLLSKLYFRSRKRS
ncbi:hypothetical protein ACFL0P_06470 [Candidatus Omnitrophota bacterium]